MTSPSDVNIWPHLGAVLAGGGSSRFGRPKATLPLPDGRSMIQAVAEAMAGACRAVVVVGQAEPLPDLERMPHIEDLRPDQGPLGGIEALLASGHDTRYLVCPCDLPFITPELLRELTVDVATQATVFRVQGDDTVRPLPACITDQALPTVMGLLGSGQRAVHQLLEVLETTVIDVPESWSRELTNVNTPEDYERL